MEEPCASLVRLSSSRKIYDVPELNSQLEGFIPRGYVASRRNCSLLDILIDQQLHIVFTGSFAQSDIGKVIAFYICYRLPRVSLERAMQTKRPSCDFHRTHGWCETFARVYKFTPVTKKLLLTYGIALLLAMVLMLLIVHRFFCHLSEKARRVTCDACDYQVELRRSRVCNLSHGLVEVLEYNIHIGCVGPGAG
jgi:hypothetical protein